MARGLLTVAAAAALLTAGCDGRVSVRSDRAEAATLADLRSVSRLTCPEREGSLTRTAAAADGSTCTYAGRDGVAVQLELVDLDGRSATDVLTPYQTSLDDLIPSVGPDDFDVDVNADGDGEQAHIRLPGVSIEAEGETARVRVGNAISIDADGANDVVRINSQDETVDIRSSGGGRAEIRTDSGQDGAVRSTYILTTENPGPSGYRLAGYEARGPADGPMVVAVVKATRRESDDSFDAMKALVERNVGG